MGLHRCEKHGDQTGPLCCRHVIDAATKGIPLQADPVRSGIAWVINDGSKTTPVLVCSECAATGNIDPDSSISAETWESDSHDGTLPWVAPTCQLCVQELEKRIASQGRGVDP